MQIADHRLISAAQIESPNQDKRPFGEISLIVLHGISLPAGEFGGPEVSEFFTNTLDAGSPGLEDLAGLKVSSHLYVRRDGSVQQFVAFDRRAWHAGLSSFRGRENCNDFSIGIELEGTDKLAYEDAQYQELALICRSLMNHYGITDIVGHCHIAPGRKTDPGEAFDWSRFRRSLASLR